MLGEALAAIMECIGPLFLLVGVLFITALATAIGVSAIAGSTWVWRVLVG